MLPSARLLMIYPVFIDIELSTPDEGGYPTSIVWSLKDGQMKSVIICPDDDWNPWENTDGDVDIQHLFDQGVTGPDIIREMNDDLDGQTVFVDGLDNDEQTLELFYETYGETLSFEVAPISKLFQKKSMEQLLALQVEIASQHQFDLTSIEGKLKSLLFLYSAISSETPVF